MQLVSIGDPVLAHEIMQISETADKGWAYRPFEVCCESSLFDDWHLLGGCALTTQLHAETVNKASAKHLLLTHRSLLEEHEKRRRACLQ